MKFFKFICVDTIGDIRFYSIVEDPDDDPHLGPEHTEFNAFIERFSGSERDEEFQEIIEQLNLFERDRMLQGRHEDFIRALPAQGYPVVNAFQSENDLGIRLYYLEYYNSVVLFGGHVKTQQTARECPQVRPYFDLGNQIAPMFDQDPPDVNEHGHIILPYTVTIN